MGRVWEASYFEDTKGKYLKIRVDPPGTGLSCSVLLPPAGQTPQLDTTVPGRVGGGGGSRAGQWRSRGARDPGRRSLRSLRRSSGSRAFGARSVRAGAAESQRSAASRTAPGRGPRAASATRRWVSAPRGRWGGARRWTRIPGKRAEEVAEVTWARNSPLGRKYELSREPVGPPPPRWKLSPEAGVLDAGREGMLHFPGGSYPPRDEHSGVCLEP